MSYVIVVRFLWIIVNSSKSWVNPHFLTWPYLCLNKVNRRNILSNLVILFFLQNHKNVAKFDWVLYRLIPGTKTMYLLVCSVFSGFFYFWNLLSVCVEGEKYVYWIIALDFDQPNPMSCGFHLINQQWSIHCFQSIIYSNSYIICESKQKQTLHICIYDWEQKVV